MSDLHDDVMRSLHHAGEGPDPGPAPVIRFMREETVEIPLWHGVLLFNSVSDLIEFGASPDLASAVANWGRDSQKPSLRLQQELELRAHVLIERLNDQFGGKYQFVYRR
ncbi:MAG: hypothetical protein ABWY23_10605 [Mycetocola sp.]